jgi:fatty acid desaturase
MAATAESVRRGLMREAAGLLPNLTAIGYAVFGHLGGLALLAAGSPWLFPLGVLLTAHSMVIAAYLIHESAHYTLFREQRHNRWLGELMGWLCGAAYASFDRIRHMHIRHHRDRADVALFDYKTWLLARPAWLRRVIFALEWAYIPAVELLMHYQVLVRPFRDPEQRSSRARVILVGISRLAFFALLFALSPWALLGYAVAYVLFLTVLNIADGYHHTFDQYFVARADEPVPMDGKDRVYELANTYSNLVSARWPWLNLLTLNFGYHNAHHERAAVPWYRLPALHAELYGENDPQVMTFGELLRSFHRHRLRRILEDDYGAVGDGPNRADAFIGAHGVSFLTVV